MKNREIIYQTLDLIEENLQSDLTVYSISQKFGFSRFYFSRLFKGVTGFSPKTYILNRKISDSVSALLGSKKKIIEIAFDYGFSSPESYSRAFFKIFGSNPSDVRRRGKVNRENLCQKINRDSIEKYAFLQKQEPRIVTLDTIFLVGIPFYYDLSLKNDLSKPWQDLFSNINKIPAQKKPEKFYQLQFWVDGQDEDTIYFFIAVEVEELQDIPIQFTAKTIAKQSYLRFYHKGKSNTVGKTYEYIYNIYLPNSEYKLPYQYNFELYGDQHKGPYDDDSISEIYIPVETK